MSAKTVFISYRRDATGRAFARALKQELTHHGYDVFFDVDSIDAGKWEEQIRKQIPERAHFLLLLTPGSLDRCSDKDDWVRKEFELAVQSTRNIVPVREESVDVTELRKNAHESMQGLFGYQITNVGSASFEGDVKTLIERYIAPHMAPVATTEDAFEFRADISRIIKYAPAELIGREDELKILSDAWQQAVNAEKERPHILTFVALGGEGKTSLVAKWAAELAHENWPGCEAAFAWSFYSQGTSEKTQASSDSFLKEALVFFGDVEMANSATGSFDKGRRLAQLTGERRALLILDGLEPLQYAPTSPTGSELKDQGVSALLKALATKSDGLCVVTTRYSVPDLRNYWQTTAPEIKLTSLSNEAGVALLRTLGVKGTQKEFEQLVRDVKGHALTLNLLGSFLRDAHAGDIRKRDLVKLEEADIEEQGGHAFHVMDAYVESFKREGEKGIRALSVLRLLGLFDRPATADCLNALWTGNEIEGLTGPLIRSSEAQRNITLKRLENAHLITVNRDKGSGNLISLDAHPLLREYFAKRVRDELAGAWRSANRRLYEYLRDNTLEGEQPSLEDLQPLYQAIAHGCEAGIPQQAFDDVYRERIGRSDQYYSTQKLGAFGSELGAVACFFTQPWNRISPALSEQAQARLLYDAAFSLRALGRLTEALEPMRVSLDSIGRLKVWQNAAIAASNLSELELLLGEVGGAVQDAKQAVEYAKRIDDVRLQMIRNCALGDALHQSGRWDEAQACYRKAEAMEAKRKPQYPLFASPPNFKYCGLILRNVERTAWQMFMGKNAVPDAASSSQLSACNVVVERASKTLAWSGTAFQATLLTPALDRLTRCNAAFYLTILTRSKQQTAQAEIEAALGGLRLAGIQDYVIRGLLSRSWVRLFEAVPDGAQADLDEAWEIAERGPMRLHMADIHLYRARLFHAVKPYPWNKFPHGSEGRGPKDDLKDARKLIEKCGYWRRKEELEDAEEAAKNW